MRPLRFAVLVALSGTVALACLGAAVIGGFGSSARDTAASPTGDHRTALDRASLTAEARIVDAPPATAVPTSQLDLPDAAMTLAAMADPNPPETRVQLASVFLSDPGKEYQYPAERAIEIPNDCVADTCIDEYLWSVYERTLKVDTNKVSERIKTTVKKKGKTRTVMKTITKYVVADFTWKDPTAAEKAGMPLKDYVIGGMDRRFRIKLYHALRAMDDAGLMPGITSAFRDNYRQSIAIGRKAATDSSYHGGSRRGGYGHGLAADLVSVKGETRIQRYGASEELWKWIDAHEKELGIGRPYRDRDPPHVGPLDGKEYTDKRGGASVQAAGLQIKNAQDGKLGTKKRQLAVRNQPGATNVKPAEGERPATPAGVQP